MCSNKCQNIKKHIEVFTEVLNHPDRLVFPDKVGTIYHIQFPSFSRHLYPKVNNMLISILLTRMVAAPPLFKCDWPFKTAALSTFNIAEEDYGTWGFGQLAPITPDISTSEAICQHRNQLAKNQENTKFPTRREQEGKEKKKREPNIGEREI